MISIKRIIKWFLYFLLIPATYLAVALSASVVVVGREAKPSDPEKVIYLGTNGVHLDIILPMDAIDHTLLTGLEHEPSDLFLAFGWGDENFYLNTPTWSDLTFNNAFTAMFLESSTLMHVTRYTRKRNDWVEIKVSERELKSLMNYVQHSFQPDEEGRKQLLANQGYTSKDDFYKAIGSYSCFKTCNTWVNQGFKESGLKACLWTPFDFGLMNQYR